MKRSFMVRITEVKFVEDKRSLRNAAKIIKWFSTVGFVTASVMLAVAAALFVPALFFDHAVTVPPDSVLSRLISFFATENAVTVTDICIAYSPRTVSAAIGIAIFALLRKYCMEVREKECWFYDGSFRCLSQVTVSLSLAFFVPLVLSKAVTYILPAAFDVPLHFNTMALILSVIMLFATVKAKNMKKRY